MTISKRRGRILVVDDNLLNLELATDVLEASGYTVQSATTAERGIAMALADPPDLILMDIGLPGMDGFAAVHMLRADSRTARLPIVALTAFAMAGDEAKALTAGFSAHIAKPIDTRGLPATVARLLQLAMGET